jgi:hypothetical protein
MSGSPDMEPFGSKAAPYAVAYRLLQDYRRTSFRLGEATCETERSVAYDCANRIERALLKLIGDLEQRSRAAPGGPHDG